VDIYWILAIFVLLSYLVGSFPTGYIIAKKKGIDIQKKGSGATGATNVTRTLGLKYGIVVMIVDVLKCFIFTAIAFWFFKSEWLVVAVVMASTLGHIFPCFLKFKGGKGVATIAGGLIPLLSWFWIPVIVLWGALLLLTKKMSLTNLLVVLTIPVFLWICAQSIAFLILGIVIIIIFYFSHRENIARLIKGTEPNLF